MGSDGDDNSTKGASKGYFSRYCYHTKKDIIGVNNCVCRLVNYTQKEVT